MQHLLLLHGAIGAKDQLKPLADRLQETFKIHTLNFSGHGGTTMPENFGIEQFAKDVLKYLDENKVKKVNIFGYSMGGYVALFLAKNYPEKVEKIFTLGTKFEWTPEIAIKESKMLNAGKIEEKIPAFAEILKKRHYPNDWKVVLQKTAEMMIELGHNNTLKLSDYKQIHQPVCLGIGENDTMVSKEETLAVASNLLNKNYILLKETQHPIEKVDIELLLKELNSFF